MLVNLSNINNNNLEMKKPKEESSKIAMRIEEIKEAFSDWGRSEAVAKRVQDVKIEKDKQKEELLKSLREQLESLA